MSCCSCEGYQSQFGEKHAAKDLRRYRQNGPDKTTRLLLDQLIVAGVRDASLVDIGGGVGVVPHELLKAGADSGVHGDAAAANINAAPCEAWRGWRTSPRAGPPPPQDSIRVPSSSA